MPRPYLLAPLAALLLAAPHLAQAQTTPSGGVGIGTTAPDASAALDIVSSGKGVLLPRVAAASAIASPAPGLLVYQTGSPAGFYYNSGTAAAPAWLRLSPGDNLGNHTATQALNLGANPLVGNGGSTGLSVDAAGNAQLPAANAYTYAAPKAYAISYGPSDFQTAQVGVSVPTNKILNMPTGFKQMYVDQAGTVRTGLHLPQGAVVTSLLLYYTQSAANASSYITLELVANRMSNRGGATRLAAFTSSGTYTAVAPATIVPSAATVIDNNTFCIACGPPSARAAPRSVSPVSR